MANNYVGVGSQYDGLPSDVEPPTDPEVKLYDGFSNHKPPGRYMEPTRVYDNPKHEEWIKTQPMRYANGLSISDTITNEVVDVVSHYSLPDNENEGKLRRILKSNDMDTNFVYHSIDQHTLINVLRTELDILEEQGWYDRDEETIRTWLNRRIDRIDNEIKIEKRVKGGNNKTDTT